MNDLGEPQKRLHRRDRRGPHESGRTTPSPNGHRGQSVRRRHVLVLTINVMR